MVLRYFFFLVLHLYETCEGPGYLASIKQPMSSGILIERAHIHRATIYLVNEDTVGIYLPLKIHNNV